MYHGGKMRKNKNIFSNNKSIYSSGKKGGGSKAIVLLLIIVLGSLLGFTIFKLYGENFFTSKTPITVIETPVETEVEIVVKPEDLVDQSNHIHAVDKFAYSTLDVRNWISSVEPYQGEKLVFLTFDDGPSPENTGKILDILKEKEARATFFTLGTSIEKNGNSGDVLNRILNEGSAIAIHSYTHVYDTLYPGKTGDKDAIMTEIDKMQELIRTVTKRENFKSSVFRYPGGHMSWKGLDVVDSYLAENGIEYIDWNAMNGDSEPTSRRPKDAQGTANFVMESLKFSKVKDVVVVLMHDASNKNLTVEALPQVIDVLKSEGYTFGILK